MATKTIDKMERLNGLLLDACRAQLLAQKLWDGAHSDSAMDDAVEALRDAKELMLQAVAEAEKEA